MDAPLVEGCQGPAQRGAEASAGSVDQEAALRRRSREAAGLRIGGEPKRSGSQTPQPRPWHRGGGGRMDRPTAADLPR